MTEDQRQPPAWLNDIIAASKGFRINQAEGKAREPSFPSVEAISREKLTEPECDNPNGNQASWCDSQRMRLATYEYMCRIVEAKRWIEETIGERLVDKETNDDLANDAFENRLRDGVLLCKMMRIFEPRCVKKIFQSEILQFRHSDNICFFLAGCGVIGLPKIFFFELVDLYERKNIPKVIYCLHALSALLVMKGRSNEMRNLRGVITFDEKEIAAKTDELRESGISLPVFSDVPQLLADHLPAPPVVEVGPTEKELEAAAILIQSICRAIAVNENFYDKLDACLCIQRCWRRKFVSLQRGAIQIIQASVRRMIMHALFQLQHKKCIALQAGVRAHNALCASSRKHSGVKGVQAFCRKASVQREFSSKKGSIVFMQAVIRSASVRIHHYELVCDAAILLQAACRTAIACYWCSLSLLAVRKIQHFIRSKRVFDFYQMLRLLISELLQPTIRMLKERRAVRLVLTTIQLQSTIRTSHFRQSLQRIRRRKGCNLTDILRFFSLFDQDTNIQRELECDAQRAAINRRINEVQEKEEIVADMDVKVGLLLKNTLSLEDLVKAASSKRSSAVAKPSSSSLSVAGTSTDQSNTSASKTALLGLDRDNHTKLKQYRQLLYLFQTDPKYLGEILSEMPTAKAKVFLDEIVVPMFGYGQSTSEEYLLLQLARHLLERQVSISQSPSADEFMTRDLMSVRLVLSYARGAKELSYLRGVLGPLISEVIAATDSITFETDPLAIYREHIKQEELETGTKSSLPYDIPKEEAFAYDHVKQAYITNLRSLQQFTKKFFTEIFSSADALPYGIRYLAKKLFSLIPEERVVGHFVYYRYINPAIVAPEAFDVLDRPIGMLERKHLAEISRMLQFIILGRTFSHDDYPHLIPMNDFITQCNRSFRTFITAVVQVPELAEQFSLTENVLVESDYVYISLAQLFRIHEAICSYSVSLKDVIATIGPAPVSFRDDPSTLRLELMKPRNLTVYQLDSRGTLLLHVKKFLLTVFKCILKVAFSSASSELPFVVPTGLLELLQADPEDCTSCENVFTGMFDFSDEMMTVNSIPVDYVSSFQSLCRCLLNDLDRLEGFQQLSRANGFSAIFDSFAQELHDRVTRDAHLALEQRKASHTLAVLEERNQALDAQLQTIQEYIRSAIQQLSQKARAKKPLPFTRHYNHLRSLEKQGKVPQYGSFKYTAAELYEKGILYSVTDYSVSQYDKISITISSDDPGTFIFEATLMGIKIPQSPTIKLEELLDCQFNNVQKMTIFGGIAKVNVNLLLHFLNKKFFA